MIEFDPFYQLIAESPLNPWLDTLPHQLAHWRQKRERDDIKKWLNIIDNLPQVTPSRLDLLHRVHAEITPGFSDHQREEIKKLLRGLMPWRKGPFSLYGVNIDTEWRSDWKWQRILPHLSSLEGRTVLDVGCVVMDITYGECLVLVCGLLSALIPCHYFFANLKRFENSSLLISGRICYPL